MVTVLFGASLPGARRHFGSTHIIACKRLIKDQGACNQQLQPNCFIALRCVLTVLQVSRVRQRSKHCCLAQTRLQQQLNRAGAGGGRLGQHRTGTC